MSARLPFSVVTKPTGAACNLDCQYCFFLSKELLYDAAAQTMSEQTLERYVEAFLESSPDGEVTMLWQGGEPTLRGLHFFECLIQLCEHYRRPTQRVRHALQTNGTLVTDEWARFFADHDFLVGVSIDGPAPLHDAYRINRGGRGTHAMVVRGWEALTRAGVETNILCTVNAANEEHGEQVYRYFRDDLGARYLQFIPIVERVRAADLAQAERGWRSGTSALLYRQDGDCVTSRSTSLRALPVRGFRPVADLRRRRGFHPGRGFDPVGHVRIGHGVRARTPVRGEHGDGVQRRRVRLRSLGGAGLADRLDQLLVLRTSGLLRQNA